MNKRNRAFTLLETIIVIGLLLVVLPVIYSIAFVISREQYQLINMQKLKDSGDFIRSQIIYAVKNEARGIVNCDVVNGFPNPSPIYRICFADKASRNFGYYIDSTSKIASIGPNINIPFDVDNSDFSSFISPVPNISPFANIDDRAIKFEYEFSAKPKISYLNQLKLKYTYYIYLRKK